MAKVIDLPLQGDLTDRAHGLGTLGSELLTNGDFTNWTGDDPDDWTVGNEDVNNYVTEDSGKAQLVSDNSAVLSLYQSFATEVGKLYYAEFDITVNTLGWRFLIVSGGIQVVPIDNYTSEGSQSFIFYAEGTVSTIYFYRHNGGSSDYTVDNVSVKGFTPTGAMDRESAGTYINRLGLLRTAWGNRNQLVDVTGQEDITSWWSLVRCANSVYNGIVADASNNTHYIYKNGVFSANKAYVISCKAKPGVVGWIAMVTQDDSGFQTTYFDLENGVKGATDHHVYSDIEGPDSDGWYRIYIIREMTTVVANIIAIYTADRNGNTNFVGDNSSVYTYIKELMIEELPSVNVLGDDLFDQETLGSELVTNGDFETGDPPSSWTAQGTNTIEASADVPTGGGSQSIKITRVDSNWAVAQALSLTAGKTYKITFWAKLGTADSLGYVLDGISQVSILKPATWTQYTFYYNYTGKSSTFYLALVNAGTAWFDNVSVKEVTGAARGMPAAEVLGPELCPSPDCSTDFWDSKDANWTHDAVNDEFDSDGSQGTNADMREDGVVVIGEVYKVVWTIANRSAGSAWVSCGNTGVGATRDANGTYTEYIKAAGNTNFYVWGDSSFVGSVSAISIKLVSKGGLWPALAGVEAITALNDRDFSSGTIGNWIADVDGSGTCAYNTDDVGGYDDKQMLLTSSGDTYCRGYLSTSNMSLTTNTLYRVSCKVQVPAANTVKTAAMYWSEITEIPSSYTLALSDDVYTDFVGYFYLAADIIGGLLIGFSGDPADGDKMYIDDISIRPVQFSWVPYGTNTIEIDETEDALKVTYVDTNTGAKLILRDVEDLTADLTVGETYLVQVDAKTDTGDVLQVYMDTSGGTDVVTGNLTDGWITYKLVFIAASATADVLRFQAMGAGEVVYIRNLSLKAVPDLAMLEPSDYVNSATIPAKTRHEVAGLLLEGEATNMILHSGDPTNSTWIKSTGCSVANDEIGPDGVGNTATTATDSGAAGGNVNFYQPLTYSLVSDLQYAASVFAKEGSAGAFSLGLYDQTAATMRAESHFQWSGGVCSVKSDVAGTGYVKEVGNGWYRCTVVAPVSTIVGGNAHRLYFYPTEHGQDPGAEKNTIIFGLQLEESPFSTSYIPTTTCPVTRLSEAADAANNGVFWDMTDTIDEVLVEELSAEMITNGGFDTDTDWVKGAGVTITGGELVATAATSTTYQSGVGISDGNTYKVEYTISDYTSGSVKPVMLGSPNTDGKTRTAAGTYVDYIVPSGANGNFAFTFASATMDIDIVSVKKVEVMAAGTLLLDWTPKYDEDEGSGTVGVICCRDGAASLFYTGHASSMGAYDQTAEAIKSLTWERNVTYQGAVRFGFIDDNELKYEVGIRVPEELGSELISNGDMETGSGDPWLPTGWFNYNMEAGDTAQSEDARYEGTYGLHMDVNTADEGVQTNAFTTVTSKEYKVEFWAKRLGGAGSLRVWMTEGDGVGAAFQEDISAGYEDYVKYTKYYTEPSGGANAKLWLYSTGGAAEWYIDGVTVKEVTQSGEYQWGTAVLFDGSFLKESKFRMAYANEFPQNIRNVELYDIAYTQAQIEAGIGSERKRKWSWGWR